MSERKMERSKHYRRKIIIRDKRREKKKVQRKEEGEDRPEQIMVRVSLSLCTAVN